MNFKTDKTVNIWDSKRSCGIKIKDSKNWEKSLGWVVASWQQLCASLLHAAYGSLQLKPPSSQAYIFYLFLYSMNLALYMLATGVDQLWKQTNTFALKGLDTREATQMGTRGLAMRNKTVKMLKHLWLSSNQTHKPNAWPPICLVPRKWWWLLPVGIIHWAYHKWKTQRAS